MLNPPSRQQSNFGDDCGEDGQPDALTMRGGVGNTFGGKELPVDPSTCVFWCAVALGALIKGSPIESVSEPIARSGILMKEQIGIHREKSSVYFVLRHVTVDVCLRPSRRSELEPTRD